MAHGIQRLRLMPKETQGQKIVEWNMEYEGAHEQFTYDDQNFNHVTLVSVDEGATEVVVSCNGKVDTQDHAGVIGHHAGHLPIWSFLSQTEPTKPGPKIKALISEVVRSEEGMVETLHNLSNTIRDNVAYGTGSTGVGTTAEEAIGGGKN